MGPDDIIEAGMEAIESAPEIAEAAVEAAIGAAEHAPEIIETGIGVVGSIFDAIFDW